MGTGVSKRKAKTQNADCAKPSKEDTVGISKHGEKTHENKQVRSADKSKRLEGTWIKDKAGVKRFYYRPESPGEQNMPPKETIYIGTSQFPYRRPKVISVKPKPSSDTSAYADGMPGMSIGGQGINAVPNYKPQFRYHPTILPRRWSNPSVMPANFTKERVAPHRTVVELRRTESFNPDYYPAFVRPQFGNASWTDARNRPPTPVPWYGQMNRTNDYLVASSLLAVEKERDMQLHGPPVHDF